MKSILRKHFNKSVLHIVFFAMCFTALWLSSNMTASAATTLTGTTVRDLDRDTRIIDCGDYKIFLGYDSSNPKLYILASDSTHAKGEFDVTNVLKYAPISLGDSNYTIEKIIVDTKSSSTQTLNCSSSSSNTLIYYNGKNHRCKNGSSNESDNIICTYHSMYFATAGKINITVKSKNSPDVSDIASTIIKTSSDKSFDLGVKSDGSLQILSKNQQTTSKDVPSGNLNITSNILGVDYVSKNTKVTAETTDSFASILPVLNINKSNIKITMRGYGTNKDVELYKTSLANNTTDNINVILDSSASSSSSTAYNYVAPAKLTVTESLPTLNLNGSAAFKNGSFIVDNVKDSRKQSISVAGKVMESYDITKPSVSNNKINITTKTTVDKIGNQVKAAIPSNTLGLNYADTYFLIDGANEPVGMFFDVSSGQLINFRMAKATSENQSIHNLSEGNVSSQVIGSGYSKYKVTDSSSNEVSYVKNTSDASGQMKYYDFTNVKDNSSVKLLFVSIPNGYLDYIKLGGKLTKFEGSVPDATLKESFMNKAIHTVDAASNNVYTYIHYIYEPVALTVNDKAVNIASSNVKAYFYNKNKVYVESNDYEFLYEKTETKATHEGKEVTQTTEDIYNISGSGKSDAESFELKVKNPITNEEITVSFKPVVEITAVDIGNYQATKTADDSLTWLEYSNGDVVLGMYADSSNIDIAKAVFNKSYDFDLFEAHTDKNGAIVIDDDGYVETDFSKANLESFIHYFVLSGDYGNYSHAHMLSVNYTLDGLKKYAINVESSSNGSVTTYTFTYPSVFGLSYEASVDSSGKITKLIETSNGDTREVDLSIGSVSKAEVRDKVEGGMKGNKSAKSESSVTKKNEQTTTETKKTEKHTVTIHVTINGKENTFTVSVDNGSALPSVKTLAAKKYNLDAELLEVTTKNLPKQITSDLDVYVKVATSDVTSDEKDKDVVVSFVDANGTVVKKVVVKSGTNVNKLAPEGYDWNLKDDTIAYDDMTIYEGLDGNVVVSFVDANGTIVKTAVVKSGTKVSKLAPDGYDWGLNEDTVAYHDMTIYAGKIAASKLNKSYNTKNDY